ncbi:hypothetical protein BCR35DRAFT_289601 [Leucosporidium creatinivorum]|uniref:37S ribosomal protein mrp10, mitochondrial n=1 Tax=Leucosporidium creatinivorum TaxID=106004 RepID=A0A1Y2FU50_9BASI|nr:hypothetical protein BCR35DRAFT_289601 [Leucosporidium creatinivorum]
MNISKLKVKPKRQQHIQACALELTAMLGCWASAGDLVGANACKESAKKLHECMSKPQVGGKARVSSINYHLSRL